jgi:hypothetical protein
VKKLVVALGIAVLSTGAMAQTVTYIDLGNVVNGRLQDFPLTPYSGVFLPEDIKSVSRDGVRFDYSKDGLNFWNSYIDKSPGSHQLSFTTDIYGATSVYTQINTYWGIPKRSDLAYIEFESSNGMSYRKWLIGDEDIRGYNYNPVGTNFINGTSTIQVASYDVYPEGGGQWLDMQRFDLPSYFLDTSLTKISIWDAAPGWEQQYLFLSGMAVKSLDPTNNAVPEPSEWAAMGLLGSGLLGLVVRGRKKNLAN